MSHYAPLIPETAPFDAAARAFLNGWLAAYFGEASGSTASASSAVAAPVEDENFPWHDMTLPLDERLSLAEGRSLPQRLMAAMAQQDCGQCGYLCKTYAEAIATGAEKATNRCVPGGKETARMVKELLELGETATVAAAPAASIAAPAIGTPNFPSAMARLEGAIALNRGSTAKDTRQVVFDLAETGLKYEVGDALGVKAFNDPDTVTAIVERLGAKLDDAVDGPDGVRRGLYDVLLHACDIGRPTDEAVEVLASRAVNLEESQRLQALAEGYPGAGPEGADLLELLEIFPSARPPVQQLITSLGVLQPRLYSISSSMKAVNEQVHLTVAAVRYQLRGRARKGVASTFLAERLDKGASVPVFVQPAHGFRLPKDGSVPIIMIGPRTGVAPFRAFLQERRAIGAKGRNWLFFGDQHRASDFLYEEEMTGFKRDGLLTDLDLAFSRDQAERIYVQQRMREKAKELWAWLDAGAYIYVCGSITMGKDVYAALTAIIARQGGMGQGAAKAYIAKLARDERYLLDVY